MKTKRKMIGELSLSENFRLAMTEEGFSFSDLAKTAKIGQQTAYRLAAKTPLLASAQVLRVGRTLGFRESDVRERIRFEREKRKFNYSKKGHLFELLAEIIKLFETK
jgi:hypothetical protein